MKWISTAGLMMLLFGCASPARVDKMSCLLPYSLTYDQSLKQNVAISTTSGGKKTNPLLTSEIGIDEFSEAVKYSLKNQGLYSETGCFLLELHMKETTVATVWDIFTVTTRVHYILTNSSENNVVLDETIVAPYTATLSDAFYGPKRLRLANEGSAKSNIARLLQKLSELKITATDGVVKKSCRTTVSEIEIDIGRCAAGRRDVTCSTNRGCTDPRQTVRGSAVVVSHKTEER